MLAVSVVLLILLSTTLVCDAAEDRIDCDSVKGALKGLKHIIKLSVKSDIPPKPISSKALSIVTICILLRTVC